MSDHRIYVDYMVMLVAWYNGRLTYLKPCFDVKYGSNEDHELIDYFLRCWSDIPIGDFALPAVAGIYEVRAWCELWFDDNGKNFHMFSPEYVPMWVVDYNTFKGIVDAQEVKTDE